MTLKTVAFSVYCMAFLWGIFSFFWLFRESAYASLYVTVGLLVTFLLAVLAYLISKRNIWAWRIAVLFVIAGIVGTIFDDVGWIDIAFSAVSLIPLVILIKGKSLFV